MDQRFGVFALAAAALCGLAQAEESVADYVRKMTAPKNYKPTTPYRNTKVAGPDCYQVDVGTNTEDLATYNVNAGVLWPGAMVQYKTLASGTLGQVPITQRTPLHVYIYDAVALRPKEGTPGNALKTGFTVSDVQGSAVTGGLADLMRGQLFAAPNFFYTKKESHSLEQALFELNISASWLSDSVKASLRTSSETSKHTYLVKLVQQFYTAAVDTPQGPEDWFSKGLLGFGGVKVRDLKQYSSPDNPITVVKHITYGRMALLTITSEAKKSDLAAAVEASMSWVAGGGSASMNTQQRELMQSSEVRLWVYGGGWPDEFEHDRGDTSRMYGAKTAKVIDSGDKLDTLLKLLKPSGKEDIVWGRPLSYRADFIGSQLAAATNLSTKFSVCSPPVGVVRLGVRFSGAGNDKDDTSSLRVRVTDAAGAIYAEAENIGKERHWDGDHRTEGPFALNVKLPLSREAFTGGLFWQVCMPAPNDDTYKFNASLDGVVGRGDVGPTKSWSADVGGQEIHENSCSDLWRLPVPADVPPIQPSAKNKAKP